LATAVIGRWEGEVMDPVGATVQQAA
jgi:hypothetical protein